MTIATLIAAGRLDERLLAAALARLARRAASALDRRGRCRRHRGRCRPRRGARVYEGWEGVDIIVHPPGAAREEAARRRHGFDDDRPGMHRRAGRLCRGQAAGRRHHRAGDAWRARFRRRAPRAGRAARRAGRGGRSPSASPSGSGPMPAPRRWSGRCGRGARRRSWSPAASPPSSRRSPRRSGSTGSRPMSSASADGKLTGTVEGRIVDSALKHDVLVEARDRLGLSARGRRWRSATAPTTFRWSRKPGWASPIAPSRRWPRSPTRGSTIMGSTPCCGRRAFRAPSGSRPSAPRPGSRAGARAARRRPRRRPGFRTARPGA